MDTTRIGHISSFLLTILLGAVLSVVCMGITIATHHHTTHPHTIVRISCTQDEIPVNGCTSGHSSLMRALTQTHGGIVMFFAFFLLTSWIFYLSLTAKTKGIGKQFYKTRRRITLQVYAEHILRWLTILQKQDSYEVAVG